MVKPNKVDAGTETITPEPKKFTTAEPKKVYAEQGNVDSYSRKVAAELEKVDDWLGKVGVESNKVLTGQRNAATKSLLTQYKVDAAPRQRKSTVDREKSPSSHFQEKITTEPEKVPSKPEKVDN